MSSASVEEDEITGINITPLVDVVLVLLVIFMVTTNYIHSEAVKLSLPQADTAEAGNPSPSLVFAIDQDSNLYLNNKPLSWADLEKEIAATANADSQVTIKADQLAPHGEVISLIDKLRANGITEFAINVTGRKEKE